MPIERFDTLYNGRKRPDWAGSVEVDVEEMLHVRLGVIRRTKFVKGIVCPVATAGRSAAPEGVAPFRIGQSRPTSEDLAVSAYNTGAVDLDKGHVMALELGGPDVPSNIVPQWSQWQRNGEWRKMEKEIEKRARDLLKDKLYLLYHAIVRYKQYENPALATFRGFSIPTGFEIHLTTLRRLDTSWAIVASEKFRELEQSQDQTDDMMALRTMMQLEQRLDPSFDPTTAYPDLALKKAKLDKSLEARLTGQRQYIEKQKQPSRKNRRLYPRMKCRVTIELRPVPPEPEAPKSEGTPSEGTTPAVPKPEGP